MATEPLKYPIGTQFVKEFPDHGRFHGRVVSYNAGTYYHVVYQEDGDEEDLAEGELETLMQQQTTGTDPPSTSVAAVAVTPNASPMQEEPVSPSPPPVLHSEEEEGDNSYMRMVEAKRARNAAFIAQLDLDRCKPKPVKKKTVPRKKKVAVKPTPTRRSARVRKETALFASGLEEVKDREREARQKSLRREALRERKARRRSSQDARFRAQRQLREAKRGQQSSNNNQNIPPSELKLRSDEEIEEWMEELENYLTNVDQVSDQNCRDVLKQVRKLAWGEGITYHHWDDNIVFLCPDERNIMDLGVNDLHDMLDKAYEYEDNYGRDLGNGWLMRHPLKKLILFNEWKIEERKAHN